MYSVRSVVSSLICLAALSFGPSAWSFNKIIVFGDSSSDLGSSPSAVMSAFKLLGGVCATDFPCPPYVDGRISNGPVAVERLAERAGLNNPAGLAGYAIGGAMTNNGNSEVPGGPGMQQQVEGYLAGGAADPNALYVVWGGANDFSNAVATGTLGPATAASGISNLAGYVSMLVGAGAREFLVPNLPNLSLTPNARSFAALLDVLNPGTNAGQTFLSNLSGLSNAFNDGLAGAMQLIDQVTPATIKIFGVDQLFDQVVANPAAFGLANVSAPCLVGTTVCANPDQFLFWDGSHPTTSAHRILGDHFFAAAVPEAQAWVLMLFASPLLLWAVRRRMR